MNISMTNKDYDETRFLIKLHFINKAIENGSPLASVNHDGSNINTLIDVLTYVYTLLSFELDISVNEVASIQTAQLDKNVYRKMFDNGFEPLRKTPSKIILQIMSETAITYNKDDVLVIQDPNGNKWYYTFDNETVFNETPVRIEFKQGLFTSEDFYVDDISNKVILSNKWNISNDNFNIYLDGVEIQQLSSSFNEINQKNNDSVFNEQYYKLDYTDENGLIVIFSNSKFGKSVQGNVIVEYDITNGEESNGFMSTEFILPDGLVAINDTNYIDISNGGSDETSVEMIKEIAPLFKKTQDRIVSVEDLETYLKYLFPQYQYKIIGSNDLPINEIQIGKIFIYLYKIDETDGVTSLDQISHKDTINYLKSKMKLGLVPIFGKIENIDIELEYSYKFNSTYSYRSIENTINSLLKNYINKQNTISKLLLKQTIIQEKIDGLIDFNILNSYYKHSHTVVDDMARTKIHKIFELTTNILSNVDLYMYYTHVVGGDEIVLDNSSIYLDTVGYSKEINGVNQVGYLFKFTNNVIVGGEVISLAGKDAIFIYQYRIDQTVQGIIDNMILNSKNVITLEELMASVNISNKTNIYFEFLYNSSLDIKLTQIDINGKINDVIVSGLDMITFLKQSNITPISIPLEI
jgi:hypothetical protein